jgi:hypothetical protein
MLGEDETLPAFSMLHIFRPFLLAPNPLEIGCSSASSLALCSPQASKRRPRGIVLGEDVVPSSLKFTQPHCFSSFSFTSPFPLQAGDTFSRGTIPGGPNQLAKRSNSLRGCAQEIRRFQVPPPFCHFHLHLILYPLQIGYTFFPCVLSGLSRAPQFSQRSGPVASGSVLGEDVDAVIVPADACGGDGTLAFARGVRGRKPPLIIAVGENETVLGDTPEKMGIEAVGYVANHVFLFG